MFPILISAWSPDDKSRQLAASVARAIDRTTTRKDAAERMGITAARLSEWLAGIAPMQLFRLTALNEAFWDALLEDIAAQRGGYYFRPEVVTLLKGAATLRRVPLAMRPARKQEIA